MINKYCSECRFFQCINRGKFSEEDPCELKKKIIDKIIDTQK